MYANCYKTVILLQFHLNFLKRFILSHNFCQNTSKTALFYKTPLSKYFFYFFHLPKIAYIVMQNCHLNTHFFLSLLFNDNNYNNSISSNKNNNLNKRKYPNWILLNRQLTSSNTNKSIFVLTLYPLDGQIRRILDLDFYYFLLLLFCFVLNWY